MFRKVSILILMLSIITGIVSDFFCEKLNAFFFPPGMIENWCSDIWQQRSLFALKAGGILYIAMNGAFLIGSILELVNKNGLCWLFMAIGCEFALLVLTGRYCILSFYDLVDEWLRFFLLGVIFYDHLIRRKS